MGSLDSWGAIAASILLIQCIVFNLVFVALALGLWKGAGWVRGKTGVGLQKLDGLLQTGSHYANRGQSYLVAPFVRLRAGRAGIRAIEKELEKERSDGY